MKCNKSLFISQAENMMFVSHGGERSSNLCHNGCRMPKDFFHHFDKLVLVRGGAFHGSSAACDCNLEM